MDEEEERTKVLGRTNTNFKTIATFIGREMVENAMGKINQTKEIHYGQWISKCELRDDNSTSGTTYIRYDGREFIYLDKQKENWVAAMHEAELTAKEWNSPKKKWGHLQSRYLDYDCIYWLKEFLERGREDLEKRVRPEVKVWDRLQSDGLTRLYCLVYGFHPRAVDVKWMRNGEDHVPSDEMTPILPHLDGTYQIKVSVEVPTKEGDTYSCHVDHSSLEDVLIVKWERYQIHGAVIPGVVIPVVVIVLAFCIWVAIYFCKVKRNGEGEPAVNGKGEPAVHGEGEPAVHGEGEPAVHGEGEPAVHGEGDPGNGEGEPVLQMPLLMLPTTSTSESS
ncbi:unnamed protein product [Staurois parvus]|uniref:Ig-like domain-containing protein n=1 Tax=Staurois parvus TaxID=386267 RepID=A0ABN9EXA0_9NEOB|nr:unnamed protein product [Staurois parvus]